VNARGVAWRVLRDVHENDAYANLVTPVALREARLTRSDAGFVTELVYGTLRMQRLYDAVIESATNRHLDQIDSSVLDVLRLGSHQWIHLNTPAHAVVSESVNLARSVQLAKSAGFVNAVMRRITEREPDEWIERVAPESLSTTDRFAVQFSHPSWIVDDLSRALAERGHAGEIEALLNANNEAATVSLVDLRIARDADARHAAAIESSDDSLEIDERTPFSLNLVRGDPGAIIKQSGGQIRVQDVGSQLAALALWGAREPTAGENWLDLCAGPGGKAALLAALAERSGAHLEANEVSEHRAKLVRQALAPFADAHVTVNDGRSYVASAERFDRVLVDAPCSGLGALRRRPEARWRRTPADVADLVLLQQQLLEAACHVVAPGGLLAYVTCTPSISETTEVLFRVMAGRRDFTPVAVAPIIRDVTRGGVTVSDVDPFVQLWPHINNTDAMFISIFQRSAK
jgi:16S rRNA (cytosine967-C5)-methyltransferase